MSERNGNTIKDLEIFSSGEHRGKSYTNVDLDDMVRNFDLFSLPESKAKTKGNGKLRVPLVVGHDEDQELLQRSDLPSSGWIARIWRDDNKLLANVEEVPDLIRDLINSKAYRFVSSEVYESPPEGLEGGHGCMLRRVALLGGEVPQLKNLADIPTVHAESHLKFHHMRCDDKGCYAVFFEPHANSQPRNPNLLRAVLAAKRLGLCSCNGQCKSCAEKYCQTGINAGKPGPCPDLTSKPKLTPARIAALTGAGIIASPLDDIALAAGGLALARTPIGRRIIRKLGFRTKPERRLQQLVQHLRKNSEPSKFGAASILAKKVLLPKRKRRRKRFGLFDELSPLQRSKLLDFAILKVAGIPSVVWDIAQQENNQFCDQGPNAGKPGPCPSLVGGLIGGTAGAASVPISQRRGMGFALGLLKSPDPNLKAIGEKFLSGAAKVGAKRGAVGLIAGALAGHLLSRSKN